MRPAVTSLKKFTALAAVCQVVAKSFKALLLGRVGQEVFMAERGKFLRGL